MTRPVLSGLALAAALIASIAPAAAQPADLPLAAASGEALPKGIRIAETASGKIYTLSDGRTLYGLDMRTLLRAGPDPAQYCAAACAAEWQAVPAPKGAAPNIEYPRGFGYKRPAGFVDPQKAPDWTVIAAAQGPQLVYKGWHLVFVRKGDRRGATSFDKAENLSWNTLKYVPPPPEVKAPPGVKPLFVDGDYALAAIDGRLLYRGTCRAEDCAQWLVFAGGAASAGAGQWKIDTSGDTPQWTYRGARVFVAAPESPHAVPAGAQVLRP